MSKEKDSNQSNGVQPWWVQTLNVILAIVAFGIAIVFGLLEGLRGNGVTLPVFVLLVAGLALLHWVLISRQRDNFQRLSNGLRLQVKDGLGTLQDRASKLLDSKVEVQHSREELLDAIAEVYEEVAAKAKAAKAASVADYQSEIIKLFGASSVQPRPGEGQTGASIERTPFERFNEARDQAEQQSVLFHRYVRLFDEKNFLGRSKEIRVAYLHWLEDQISLLTRSNLHTLFNARRAPRWKAIRSSITSGTTFIDILGDGESGFVIKGGNFALAQRRNSDRYINSGSAGRKAILSRFSQRNVADLEEHLDEMKTLHNDYIETES
jgi:hypothetical protein